MVNWNWKNTSFQELTTTIILYKKTLKNIFLDQKVHQCYMEDQLTETMLKMFKKIKEIDGFLIGGASKSSKKFIDIIRNYYR